MDKKYAVIAVLEWDQEMRVLDPREEADWWTDNDDVRSKRIEWSSPLELKDKIVKLADAWGVMYVEFDEMEFDEYDIVSTGFDTINPWSMRVEYRWKDVFDWLFEGARCDAEIQELVRAHVDPDDIHFKYNDALNRDRFHVKRISFS